MSLPLCNPLVMSLHPRWVNKMLKGKKDVEVRRRVPADKTYLDDFNFRRPLYFVRTFRPSDERGCYRTVKIACLIDCIRKVDLRALWEGHDDAFLDEEIEMIPREFSKTALSWRQGLKYQGDRECVYFISLYNIREVNFPITALGLQNAPQSFAWAQNFPDDERRNFE